MTSPRASDQAATFIIRFDALDRALHALLMVCFLGLAATGLPLLFAAEPWATSMAGLVGGFLAAGALHRVFATLLIAVFLVHVGRIGRRLVIEKETGLLWGPASMVPQLRDVADLAAHLRWFLRLGPRPRFEHFTYWEKFDYWAVFWGMAIIGGSGLLLWFPEVFSTVLPGWVFNVALLVHGEEALLAVGFIFTIHFFNTHLRPEKFPVDRVIFTGRVTEAELREERPDEYARLVREGLLDQLRTGEGSPWLSKAAPVTAAVVIAIGLTLVGLILVAVVG
jgi:cytochrome b subunit of formate dehydrogenase